MIRILVAEDDAVSRELLSEILRGDGYDVQAVSDGAQAVAQAAGGFDLVLSDVRMEGLTGLDVLAAFSTQSPDTPVILITAFGDINGAMEAIGKGAYDYISKPFVVEELRQTVGRALERRRLSAQTSEPPRDLATIEGRSPQMLDVYKLVARVAPSMAPVLVQGESGTGKELVARTIHDRSGRSPFVPVNCTAVPDALLESELFGHARGAFTGAVGARKGLFELAHGGTLFLDEIGDMGPKMQAQLLRVLQDGVLRPVGASESVHVDVRLVCATNRDLEAEVRAGRFREDLFFRINVVRVLLPPLRQRLKDIPLLVEHFLAKVSKRERRRLPKVSDEVLRLFERYAWPGNVRELENVVERASAVAESNVILPSDLPPEIQGLSVPTKTGGIMDDRPPLEELERRYVSLIVDENGGNKKRAAELLGIDRRTLYRILARGEVPESEES
ncbi:MAG: sigma-54 dependent transcriptional regulator [Deltaproteobacteria bacterium]|nr:sigma-54 dependent transcriptional regulator [Deltaproteobacteria bacterium]